MHRIRSAAALAVVLGVATGCGAAGADHQEAGELIATYSEGGHGREWVGQVNLAEAVVLGSAVDVDNWVSTLPGADPAEFVELDQVDLTEHFLVIGGYHQCTETSAIIVITEDDDVRVVFEVASPDPDTVCDWSPYTLDVWAVPLSLTGGEVPGSVPITSGTGSSTTAPEPARPTAVGDLLATWDENTVDRDAMEAVVSHFSGPVRHQNSFDGLAAALADFDESGPGLLAVQDADPSTAFLLVTGYHSCTERSIVQADLDADPTRVWIEIEWEADVDCAWAPYTLDVWQVGLGEVGDFVYIDDPA
ncbi:hypothetical protein [Pseudactinotalea sp. Z1732]|uniref:hypothetical protein n=2 Tax=Micrococcales TaxID=85006 RepID=UPI003C7AB54E